MIHKNNHSNGTTKDLSVELHNFAELVGKQTGLQNKPKTLDEYLVLFQKPLETKLQGYIQDIESDKKPLANKVVAMENGRRAKTGNAERQSHLFDLESQAVPLRDAIKESPISKGLIILWWIIYAIIFLISFSEVSIVYQSLRLNQIPSITAIGVALGFGIGITVITHIIGEWIRKADTERKAWIRGTSSTAGAFIAFLAIALLRVNGLKQVNEINEKLYGSHTPSVASPFLFVTISTALFVIGLLIYLKYGWNKEQRDQYREYAKTKNELKRIQKEIRAIEQEIRHADNTAHQEVCKAVEVYTDALNMEQELLRIGESAQASFSRVNLNYRQDRICHFFLAHPPKFNLTFFRNKKEYNHETTNHEVE